MAAIDYIVSEKSDVFMPSHGGNMGHALQVWLYKFIMFETERVLCN
jgi:hypothetical protein